MYKIYLVCRSSSFINRDRHKHVAGHDTNRSAMKVICLMSGSSLDGLDIAYAKFDVEQDDISFRLIQAETIEFTAQWQRRLQNLPKVDALSFAKTHTYFGHLMGDMVNHFIQKHGLDVDFIASHGHTVFHNPEGRMTIQIGDGAALAAITGLPVINNFRTHDIAINGEGTPLAPIADKYLFKGYDFYLNIGGIANISCPIGEGFVAFDVGAANQIFNPLAHLLHLPYDDKGEVAKSGKVNPALLKAINSIDYFHKDYPKSLDNSWVQQNVLLPYLTAQDTIANRLRTAVEQLAQQTAFAIQHIINKEKLPQKAEGFEVFVTGGGAFNSFLIDRTEEVCNEMNIPAKLIVAPPKIVEYKEALLIGLMGVLRVQNKVNVMRSVTGAKVDTIGGAIWQGTDKVI